jgi:poly-gamma-glutamate synthesis protein (capsule biosynthesis protein)
MKKYSRLLAVLLPVILLSVGLLAVMTKQPAALPALQPSVNQPSAASLPLTEVDISPAKEKPQPALPPAAPPAKATLRMTAAGDNLIHDNIYRQAAARTNGSGFDFAPVYQNIANLFENSDIAFVNQETIIAEGLYPLSGYPRFNSPKAAGTHLVDLGFNVVNLANNHVFDKNEDGLKAALDFWGSQPNVLITGVWQSENAMNSPVVFESAQGIKVAFVAVAEQTNGLSLPDSSPLRIILSDNIKEMHRQVELAKAQSDVVVLSIHWGSEDSLDTTENQRTLSNLFADWGVDLVLGHHSHSLQPMKWLPRKGGGETLVVYSLGNLVSSMLYPVNMLGGVLDIDITKDLVSGVTEISRAHLHPIVTHYEGAGRLNVRVYSFGDYTEELAKSHGVTSTAPNFGRAYMENIIKTNIPQEFLPGLPAKTP